MLKNKETAGTCNIRENVSRIYCRLADRTRFLDKLKDVPHEIFLDMLLVYDMRLRVSEEECLTMIVQRENLQNWGISEKRLQELAWANTLRDEPVLFESLESILRESGYEAQETPQTLYMLSNKSRHLGSVCLFYPHCMEKIADYIGSDYYVLPSSIHECLILSCSEAIKACDLREMVRSINRTELKENEILSDSVYRYHRSEDRLVIDNS